MPKLIIASNRLPVTITKNDNDLKFEASSGGLATGLISVLKSHESLWIGYPGLTVEDTSVKDREFIKTKLIKDYKNHPVFLNEKDYSLFYSGFANNALWPLFHYFQYLTNFNLEQWEAYKKANEIFCNEIILQYLENDIIWVHDYHLMLLPNLLRKKLPNAKIGFFLHIPFPSYELFRLLPWRKEMLEGLLGADLIGFHTYSYYRHFLSSVLRISGLDDTFGQIKFENRNIKVDVFPMGIDFDKFYNSGSDPRVKKEIKKIKKQIDNRKIILSVDRLDYTKGILKRLESFDFFLEKFPEYQGKIILIMLLIPSRTDVNSYNILKSQVDEAVGRINGKYSKPEWSPILYLYRNLNFEYFTALYNVADIALLTPLRDGMNLVAKEYVSAKANNSGVLIISEMAGVAEELGEAVVINPFNKEEIAKNIDYSLKMAKSEQTTRLKSMQNRLKRNNVFKWANDFLEKLNQVKGIQKTLNVIILNNEGFVRIKENYNNSSQRLIILDYDGTIVPFKENPADAVPDKPLLEILKKLSSDDKNDIAIVSGRDKLFLEKSLLGFNKILIAEHGMKLKNNNEEEWSSVLDLDNSWKDQVRPILEMYVDRTPKTYIEEKENSLVWHYRRADPEFAEIREKELRGYLLNIVANLHLNILEGNKVLEIKNIEINKGKAVKEIISRKKYDFIIAMGDDMTDEDIFEILPADSFSIKVGYDISKAKYNLNSFIEVRELLKTLGK